MLVPQEPLNEYMQQLGYKTTGRMWHALCLARYLNGLLQ